MKASLVALGVFLGVAVWLTWPLALHLNTHIPGLDAGDNVSFVWNLWWFRDQAGWWRPFDCPLVFAPYGTSLVLSTHTALPAIVAATLLRPLNVIAAQNVIILAGLTLNGWLVWRLASRVVPRQLPALLAGLSFSGAAYVSVHLLGHFNLIHAWTLPLFALAWIPLVERPSSIAALRAGAALAIVIYTDYYYAVFAGVFAVVWWLTQTVSANWSATRRRPPARILLAAALALLAVDLVLMGWSLASGGTTRNLLTGLWLVAAIGALAVWRVRIKASFNGRAGFGRAVAVTAAACLALTVPIAIAAIRLITAGDYVTESPRWLSGARGLDVASLVFGHPLNTWIGPAVRRLYGAVGANVLEQTAWLGLAPLAILAAAWRRRPRWTRDPWAVVGLVFLIWALGPFLTIARFETGLVLPEAVLRYLPLLSNARIPGRALIVVQLAASILCARALVRLQWDKVAILGVVAVALADSATAPYPLYRMPEPGAVEAYLRDAAHGTGAILELPAGIADGFGGIGLWDQRVLAWQMAHGHPIVGGSSGRTPDRLKRAYLNDPVLGPMFDLSARQVLDESRRPWPADANRYLQDLGIQYVGINRDSAPAEVVEYALAKLRLRRVATDGPRELYEIQ